MIKAQREQHKYLLNKLNWPWVICMCRTNGNSLGPENTEAQTEEEGKEEEESVKENNSETTLVKSRRRMSVRTEGHSITSQWHACQSSRSGQEQDTEQPAPPPTNHVSIWAIDIASRQPYSSSSLPTRLQQPPSDHNFGVLISKLNAKCAGGGNEANSNPKSIHHINN